MRRRTWTVLLIGGSSGTGKTTATEEIARRFDVPWIQVDDLRLALQQVCGRLRDRPEALFFFEETPDVWRLPPERLRDGLIAVGAALAPAVRAVVGRHLTHGSPVVLEGDGMVPSMLAEAPLRERVDDGSVRAVFVIEPDEEAILASLAERGRERGDPPEGELRAEAHAKWLHGRWLADQASRHDLPVLPPQPWDSLTQRIERLLG